MILVDTSVWIDHFRSGSAALADLLADDQVLMHPFVLGELACGNLRRREEILALLQVLPVAPVATTDEVLSLLESRKLFGKGAGWIDVHLMAAALLGKARLWSHDKNLRKLADGFHLSFEP